MKILVDMDEVLVDYTGGAAKVHGVDREELERRRKPGKWSIVEPLGGLVAERLRAAGCKDERFRFGIDEFWAPIHAAGSEFWKTLEPLPWAEELLDLFKGYEWHVVTAPSRCPTSYDGKVCWLKRYFGASFDRFIITPHKYLLARHGHLLIDDREKNCTEFSNHGGRSLLFPSRGNRLYHWADNPLHVMRSHHLFSLRSKQCTSKLAT